MAGRWPVSHRSRWLLVCLVACLRVEVVSSVSGSASQVIMSDTQDLPAPTFSLTWAGLGPFQIGTREIAWGADPLEAHGGFANLEYSEDASFPSSLASNASIRWQRHDISVTSSGTSSTTAHIKLAYSNIDWTALQHTYGWSALQFQSWLRGDIQNHAQTSVRALLYSPGLVEYRINGRSVFGGDLYSLDRAPVLVTLEPGNNRIDVRLMREVRAMGGTNVPPEMEASIRVCLADAALRIDLDHLIAPDLVGGRLPSTYISLPMSNLLNEDIWLERYVSDNDSDSDGAELLSMDAIHLVPGQTRPVAFTIQRHQGEATVKARFCYKFSDTIGHKPGVQSFTFPLTNRSLTEAHKYTFLYPSGTVSYAVLKPPHRQTLSGTKMPLLLLLHGAGVEADSPDVRHALDGMGDLESFALFPTGMSPWCGDDWHIWGLADAIAAMSALDDWITQMQWEGAGIDTDRVVLTGHSNGGQGVWFFSTHLPGRVIAAAPVSAYTSIENYVPYNLWHHADPVISGILHSARMGYKHELFVDNLKNLPILVQHGSNDDNVPPFNSRLMTSLLTALNSQVYYSELAGKNHWFDGVMTTDVLQKFYRKYLNSSMAHEVCPRTFRLVSSATCETGALYGVSIEALESPHQLGRADVEIDHYSDNTTVWTLTLHNVKSISLRPTGNLALPTYLKFKHDRISRFDIPTQAKTVILTRDQEHSWVLFTEPELPSGFRTGRQRGALDAILRGTGPFLLVSCIDDSDVVLQTSRNFYQYFGADSVLVDCSAYADALTSHNNIVTFALGPDVPPSMLDSFPVVFTPWAINLRPKCGATNLIGYQAGLGMVMLRPLSGDRLELLVWGHDMAGLRQVARLIPTLTGAGQPDFVVLGPESRWLGAAGSLAMGFFDYTWEISRGSYLPY